MRKYVSGYTVYKYPIFFAKVCNISFGVKICENNVCSVKTAVLFCGHTPASFISKNLTY